MPPKGPERDFTKKGVAARNPICELTIFNNIYLVNIIYLAAAETNFKPKFSVF